MNRKSSRLWLWYVLSAALVGADQLVKYLVRANMRLGEQRPFIPRIVELYYIRNTGAAFSLFSEHTWLLTLVSAAVSAALIVILSRRRWLTDNWGRLSVSLLLGGAVGNLIDRALFGSVTDMFNFTFMTFGIFNVADMCVTVGVVIFVLYLLLSGRKEGDYGAHSADSPR